MSGPAAPGRTIALVGLSGVGKSATGRILAARLGRPLFDTDTLVIEAAGRSVAEIFSAHGEARFRELEAAALRSACDRGPCVIATGGGVVLRADNRALLRERAYIVWLDAPTPTLLARLRAHDEPRPLLAGDYAARLDQLRAERARLYENLADLRISTDQIAPEAICERIVSALAGPA